MKISLILIEHYPGDLESLINNENHKIIYQEGEGCDGKIISITKMCIPALKKNGASLGW